MYLSKYDIVYLGQRAEKLGFVRDTLEKVIRLADLLEYLNTNPLLKDSLGLKGGTAINLTIFNLPRLSVDIDMDYLISNSKEEMLENRKTINDVIERYMISQGYSKSPKTRNSHSLDSWVYEYICAGGNKDNIKIEINYSLRSHVLPSMEKDIMTDYFTSNYKVKSLDSIEIFGSKINALLDRAAARDLYDTRNMIRCGIFDKSELEILKKCIIYYAAKSAVSINKSLDTKAIDSITQRKIKRELLPVIRKGDDFDLVSAKNIVKEYIYDLMILTKEEKEFLNRFEQGEYIPELLFEDNEILDRIKNHQMSIWKTTLKKK